MSPPSLDDWPRLSALLDEVLELDGAARAGRLADLQAADPAAARVLEGLVGRLTSIERDGFLLQSPRLADDVHPGQAFGAYAIERAIGQGGMGSVWLARRIDGRFEGQVAIKVLAAGLAPRAGATRFAREGSMLARLAHPHIARLLDAGVAEGNQPYLVLEYVDGTPIDQHCRTAALDVPARVRLCLDVLDAVAHAHTRLILHRDIKPANILVTAAGEVKLLDFGIAKLLDAPTGLGAATELTRESGNAYTMLYAAPEQVQAGEVTTATDVYALGVLLHVLLSGLHPMDGADTPMERMRRLVDVEPPPMSMALAAGSPASAEAGRLARRLRGDLDTIVAKALKKQPVERYANAQQLADDLRRWLADEPILARPDARSYRLRKFLARHRTGVVAFSFVLLALTVGIGVALWQAAEARGQQVQAEGLIEFMLGDLRTKLQPVGRLDALDAVGGRVMAYYARQGQGRLDAESLGRRARAQHLIGEIAETRGNLPEAISVFLQAEASTAALLARHPDDGQRVFDHAQSVYWVGYIAWRQGRLPEAAERFGQYQALAKRLTELDARNLDWRTELAYAHLNLGTVLLEQDRAGDARSVLVQAQSELRALLPGRPQLGEPLGNATSLLSRVDERDGSLGQAIDSLKAKELLHRGNPALKDDRSLQRELAATLSEIARLELLRGQVQVSVDAAMAGLALISRLHQLEPLNTLWQQDLAAAHVRVADGLRQSPADLSSASRHARRATELARALVARDPTVVRWQVHGLGRALLAQLEVDAAGQGQDRLAALRQWLDARTPQTWDTLSLPLLGCSALAIANALARQGRLAEASPYWQRAELPVSPVDGRLHPLAAACAALASAALGHAERARTMARQVLATEFRHPDYVGRLTLLAGSQG